MTELERITTNLNNFIDNRYGVSQGLHTWNDWINYKSNKEQLNSIGASINNFEHNVVIKGKGSTSKPSGPGIEKHGDLPNQGKKLYIKDAFKFNYDDLLNCTLDKKFNRLHNITFKHEFFNKTKNDILNMFINTYNEYKINGKLNKIEQIYQKLSTYISKNKLNKEETKLEGSILLNVAIITAKYSENDKIITDIIKIESILNEIVINCNISYEIAFNIFLIHHCFSNDLHWYYLYDNEDSLIGKILFGNIGRRLTNSDMKTKYRIGGLRININHEKYDIYDLISKSEFYKQYNRMNSYGDQKIRNRLL